ncbi:TXNDC2 isoform 5 [Pongo abelii]|uniref:TXNDC2 isoform 5 n=1 Tax=Pongo abelii TaxID=9601 RepID=A0A2J8XH72_PONAB|nr:TXNDC2 isoform 5 [Pongo abelii]
MDVDKELVMESVNAGASGKPEMRLGTQEETNEGDANESSLQVLSSNVPLLALEFLDTAQAKEKAFLPMVSHTFHMRTEESDAPQEGDDLPKSSANTSHPKQGDIPKSPEETIQPKEGDIRKSPEETIQSKKEDLPKSSEEAIQPKEGDIPKSSAQLIQPKLGNIPKTSVKPSQPKEAQGVNPKSPEEAIQPKEGDIPSPQKKPSSPRKHEDVVFLEVDADNCEEVVRDCAIMCVPTFQFYKKEEKVDELCGALKEKLEAVIAELK